MSLFARIALFLPVAALLTWITLTASIALTYWLTSPHYPALRCLVRGSSETTRPCEFMEYISMATDIVVMTAFMSGGIFFLGPFAIIFCVLFLLQAKFGKTDDSFDRKFREHQESRLQRPPEA